MLKCSSELKGSADLGNLIYDLFKVLIKWQLLIPGMWNKLCD